jgi:hypothetical protein
MSSHLSIVPSASFFRQLVGILANNYPYMFLGDPTVTVQGMQVPHFHGNGTGGLTGISSFPKTLQQKFSRMLESKHGLVKKKRDLPDENSEAKVSKKRSNFIVSGWTGIMLTSLRNIPRRGRVVTSTEERESIFCDHKTDLQHKLVNSVNIYSVL